MPLVHGKKNLLESIAVYKVFELSTLASTFRHENG